MHQQQTHTGRANLATLNLFTNYYYFKNTIPPKTQANSLNEAILKSASIQISQIILLT